MTRREKRQRAEEKRQTIKNEIWDCLQKEYNRTKDMAKATLMASRVTMMMIVKSPQDTSLIRSSALQLVMEFEERAKLCVSH